MASNRKQPDPMIGRTLNGTYTLERRIGFGGMGRVYSGQHLRLSRPVAVKVLQSKFSSNPDAVERFRHEARLASALGHSNIVQVFDFNQSQDQYWYIVMELLEGEDLRTMLKREKRLDPVVCLPILRQTCDALDLAHSKGLVHRDLKPSNIYLLNRSGRIEVKVLDFGVAKILGADHGLTMDGAMLGTPHYMAPEQAAGEGTLTPRVDIYALGTVLFEMLAGRRPFEGDSPLTVLHQRATRNPPLLSSIVTTLPKELDAVVNRALARDPTSRFESPAEMALAFEKALPPSIIASAQPPQTGIAATITESPASAFGPGSEQADIPTESETGQTLLGSLSGTGSSASQTSSSVVRLKSSDELRMATIVVVTVSPADPDEADPDEMLEQTETLLEKLSVELASHGGNIEQNLGDALIGVFGVPKATGDDPVHAVRAGLAASHIVREEGEHDFEIRVGIQTGRILKRSGRSGVTGEVVKVANRVADECPDGTVLVGQDTFSHIRGRFDVSYRDQIRIRGQRKPLRTYRVTGERDHGVVLEAHGGDGGEPKLMGRGAELAFLRGLFARAARESQAQVVQLVGGSGSGKSRLAHELISKLEEQSERLSYFPARASELTAPSPYGLLGEIIRVKTGTSRGTSGEKTAEGLVDLIAWPFKAKSTLSAAVVEKSPISPVEIARTIGAAVGIQVSPGGEAGNKGDVPPEKLALAMATYLRTLSRKEPVILVFDDLHRSDEETLELLEAVMRQLEDVQVMLLGLSRPEFEESHPTFMGGIEHHTTIRLRSLSIAAVTSQVNALLDGLAPVGLGAAIHKRSGGNPHLVEEMIHALRDTGELCREEGSGPWVFLGDLEELDVPSRAEALLQARLDQLPKQDQELLRCAAVIGPHFWEGAVVNLGLERVEARLDALAQTDLIQLRPTSRFAETRQWAFKSELMAEVARGNLPARDRRQIHMAMADWLGTQDQHDPGNLSLRADHLVKANQRSAALDLMAEAGRIAERQQRWQVALMCFSRAYKLALAEGDEASGLYFASHVGRLGVRAHAPSKSVTILEQAIEQARASDDEAMEANLLQLLGRGLAIKGEPKKAREVTERALEVAEKRGEARLSFEAAKALGFVLYYADEFADAVVAFEKCIEMAEELNDEAEVAMNIYNVADSCLHANDWKKALQFADRAVAACSGREKVSFLRHTATGISAFVRARHLGEAAAKGDLERWMAYADENGYMDQQLDSRHFIAEVLEHEGRQDEALAVARTALALAKKSEGEQGQRTSADLVARLEALSASAESAAKE